MRETERGMYKEVQRDTVGKKEKDREAQRGIKKQGDRYKVKHAARGPETDRCRRRERRKIEVAEER